MRILLFLVVDVFGDCKDSNDELIEDWKDSMREWKESYKEWKVESGSDCDYNEGLDSPVDKELQTFVCSIFKTPQNLWHKPMSLGFLLQILPDRLQLL